MELSCIIRLNNFQIVPNCGERSLSKSNCQRHLKLCCFPPSPCAICCGKCCALLVAWVNTPPGWNTRHMVERGGSLQTINAAPFDTQQSNHITIRQTSLVLNFCCFSMNLESELYTYFSDLSGMVLELIYHFDCQLVTLEFYNSTETAPVASKTDMLR